MVSGENIINHNRHITLENSNIIIKYTNERIIPASGLAVVGALPERYSGVPSRDNKPV